MIGSTLYVLEKYNTNIGLNYWSSDPSSVTPQFLLMPCSLPTSATVWCALTFNLFQGEARGQPRPESEDQGWAGGPSPPDIRPPGIHVKTAFTYYAWAIFQIRYKWIMYASQWMPDGDQLVKEKWCLVSDPFLPLEGALVLSAVVTDAFSGASLNNITKNRRV